jgi:hypothetical protein
MYSATFRSRIALVALFIGAITACGDAPSLVGPLPAEGPSLKQGGNGTPGVATPHLLVSGLQGAFGSTIGPHGALFVAEYAAGRISRIDPQTGAVTTFASGLPSNAAVGGGVFDVAFIGQTAYALVSVVTPEVGGSGQDGIYRVDGPNSFTIVADIGAFNRANPPETDFFVPTGVPFALEPFRNGFLVSDGHFNRVLFVTRDGEIRVLRAFDNVVPTGLAVRGNRVYIAEAGPLPHLPESGKVVAFEPKSATAAVIASGARLVVDVGFGRGNTLFALSQGIWNGVEAGSPALPNTGALVRVNDHGSFTTVVGGLDRPISLQIIGNTAYIVTLTGKVWTIDNVAEPPFGSIASK